MRKTLVILSVVVGCVVPFAAVAAPVTPYFGGYLSSAIDTAVAPFSEIGVHVGDPASGFFTVDTSVLDTVPDDPKSGDYPNALLAWGLTVGSWSIGQAHSTGNVAVSLQPFHFYAIAGSAYGASESPSILGSENATGFQVGFLDFSASLPHMGGVVQGA